MECILHPAKKQNCSNTFAIRLLFIALPWSKIVVVTSWGPLQLQGWYRSFAFIVDIWLKLSRTDIRTEESL